MDAAVDRGQGGLELPARFLAKIAVDARTGCHNWTGALGGTDGRAQIKWGGKVIYAYRLALAVKLGRPVEEILLARHVVCDNPRCVNGEHLEDGTHRDNAQDRVNAGRQRNGTTAQTLGTVAPTREEAIEARGEMPRWKIRRELALQDEHLRCCAAGL